jgi:protein-S-isoprenylcysteine O-methyltransferase Ste14
VGVAIQWIAGPLLAIPWGLPRYVFGVGLFALGSGLLVAAGRLFQQTGQDPKPWESSPEIIASGIYRYTRNPMYLGMGVIQAALGVLLANVWVVALVPLSWAIIYVIAIRHEEAYLAGKFGQTYLDYKASVRRWL